MSPCIASTPARAVVLSAARAFALMPLRRHALGIAHVAGAEHPGNLSSQHNSTARARNSKCHAQPIMLVGDGLADNPLFAAIVASSDGEHRCAKAALAFTHEAERLREGPLPANASPGVRGVQCHVAVAASRINPCHDVLVNQMLVSISSRRQAK